MSTYLVIKRMRRQGVDYMPSMLLTDPGEAAILMQRGYIAPVPDNFVPPAPVSLRRVSERAGSESRRAESSTTTTAPAIDPPRLPTVEEALEVGYSQDNAETLAAGEWNGEVEAQTSLLERVFDERQQALALAKAMDVSPEDIMDLSAEDYEEALLAYDLAPKPEEPTGEPATEVGTD